MKRLILCIVIVVSTAGLAVGQTGWYKYSDTNSYAQAYHSGGSVGKSGDGYAYIPDFYLINIVSVSGTTSYGFRSWFESQIGHSNGDVLSPVGWWSRREYCGPAYSGVVYHRYSRRLTRQIGATYWIAAYYIMSGSGSGTWLTDAWYTHSLY